MKKISLNWFDLECAFVNSSGGHHYYFDRETGRVILVTDDTSRTLENFYETLPEYDDLEIVLTAVLAESGLAEWEQQMVLEAAFVETHFGSRVVEIPRTETYEAYEVMAGFIQTIATQPLQDQLWEAIQGRGAFRRFRYTLREHPQEEQAWYAFHDKQLRQRILAWLAEQKIKPTTTTDRKKQ